MTITVQQSADDPIVNFVFEGTSDLEDIQDVYLQAMHLLQELGTFYAILDVRQGRLTPEQLETFVVSLQTGDAAQLVHIVLVDTYSPDAATTPFELPVFTTLETAEDYIRKNIATNTPMTGDFSSLSEDINLGGAEYSMRGRKFYLFSREKLLTGPAPNFSIQTFTGSFFTLADHRGKVVVLHFWASWNHLCRIEAPILEALWRQYRTKNVVILGLAYLDREKSAQTFIEEFQLTYPCGSDIGLTLAKDYSVFGVPQTIIIDPQGNIISSIFGGVTHSRIQLMIEKFEDS